MHIYLFCYLSRYLRWPNSYLSRHLSHYLAVLQIVVGMQVVTSSVKVEFKATRLICVGVLHSWRVNCVDAPAGDFVGDNFYGTPSKISTSFRSSGSNVLMQPNVNVISPYMVALQCRVQCGRRRCVRRKRPPANNAKRKRRAGGRKAKSKRSVGGGAESEAGASESGEGGSDSEGQAPDSEVEDESDDEGSDADAEHMYELDGILDKRVNWETCEHEYLVSWVGYSDGDNTWEPAEGLPDCQEAIEEFDDDLEYGSITRLAEEMEDAKKVTI